MTSNVRTGSLSTLILQRLTSTSNQTQTMQTLIVQVLHLRGHHQVVTMSDADHAERNFLAVQKRDATASPNY